MNNTEFPSLILDTHVLIWYSQGIELIPQQVNLIDEAVANNSLCISAISIWEITMLANKGKIVINIPIKDWINKLLLISKIKIIDLSPDTLIESVLLPNYEHRDPADRLIIASVRLTNSVLMTFDQKIIDYANLGYLNLAKTY